MILAGDTNTSPKDVIQRYYLTPSNNINVVTRTARQSNPHLCNNMVKF